MRKQNIRKAKWCPERMRAYVLRDGVRYWAPQETVVSGGDQVGVFNPHDAGRHSEVLLGDRRNLAGGRNF